MTKSLLVRKLHWSANKDFKKWIFLRNKAKYGVDPVDKSQLTKKERDELKKLEGQISVSRWKPDTHLRSLHGKPIFHPYGKGNTDPTVGGVVYGDYLLSHNIHPHSGDNRPKYQQVYTSAHNKAFVNGKPTLEPTRQEAEPPKLTKEELEELKSRNPIMPDKPMRDYNREVKKLDLMKEVWFASKHDTPATSEFVTSQRTSGRKSAARNKSTEDSSRSKDFKQEHRRPMSSKPKSKTHKVQDKASSKINITSKAKSQGTKRQAEVGSQEAVIDQEQLLRIQSLAKDGGYKADGHDPKRSTALGKTMASTQDFADTQPVKKQARQSTDKAPVDDEINEIDQLEVKDDFEEQIDPNISR